MPYINIAIFAKIEKISRQMIPILRTGRETRPLRAQEFNLVQPWGQEAPLYLYRGIFPPDNISLFSNYIFRAWCKFPFFFFFFCEERRRQKRLLRMRMAHNNENALSATSADNCKKAQWKKRKREERAATENWRKRRDTPRALTRDRTHHLALFLPFRALLLNFTAPISLVLSRCLELFPGDFPSAFIYILLFYSSLATSFTYKVRFFRTKMQIDF